MRSRAGRNCGRARRERRTVRVCGKTPSSLADNCHGACWLAHRRNTQVAGHTGNGAGNTCAGNWNSVHAIPSAAFGDCRRVQRRQSRQLPSAAHLHGSPTNTPIRSARARSQQRQPAAARASSSACTRACERRPCGSSARCRRAPSSRRRTIGHGKGQLRLTSVATGPGGSPARCRLRAGSAAYASESPYQPHAEPA